MMSISAALKYLASSLSNKQVQKDKVISLANIYKYVESNCEIEGKIEGSNKEQNVKSAIAKKFTQCDIYGFSDRTRDKPADEVYYIPRKNN